MRTEAGVFLLLALIRACDHVDREGDRLAGRERDRGWRGQEEAALVACAGARLEVFAGPGTCPQDARMDA